MSNLSIPVAEQVYVSAPPPRFPFTTVIAAPESGLTYAGGSYGRVLLNTVARTATKDIDYNEAREMVGRPEVFYAEALEATTTREVAFLHSPMNVHPCFIRCHEAGRVAPSPKIARLAKETLLQNKHYANPHTYRVVLDYGGSTLWEWARPLSLQDIDKHIPWIMYQLLHSLAFLSLFQVVHNDLKPWNITIDKDTLDVKLVDFGSLVFDSHIVSAQDMIATLMCTLGYACPEMHPANQGSMGTGPFGPLSPRGDVYSLGMTLTMFIHRHHYIQENESLAFIKANPQATCFDVWHMQGCPTSKQVMRNNQLVQLKACEGQQAIQAWAPFYFSAIPIIQRMMTIDWKVRPSAYELMQDHYFDSVRHRLPCIKALHRSTLRPAADAALAARGSLPELSTLFAHHPDIDTRRRAEIVRVVFALCIKTKAENTFTLTVSILDRYLLTPLGVNNPTSLSSNEYLLVALACMLLAANLRFCNQNWKKWDLATGGQNMFSAEQLNVASLKVMGVLENDLWSCTLDAATPYNRPKPRLENLCAVVQTIPLIERYQHLAKAAYDRWMREHGKEE